MSRRLYFDLTNGRKLIRDTEGVEALALNEAIEQAQSALNEIRRFGEVDTEIDGWRLIIRDENGMALRAIPLDDGSIHQARAHTCTASANNDGSALHSSHRRSKTIAAYVACS